MACVIDQHLGRKISEARTLTNKTVAQLAAEIGVDVDLLERMEVGVQRVDALSLARCSKALDRPIQWFYAGLPGQTKFETPKR